MPKRDEKKPDVMHGRSFAGAEIASTEQDKTDTIERERNQASNPSDDFVTDAELEAREDRNKNTR